MAQVIIHGFMFASFIVAEAVDGPSENQERHAVSDWVADAHERKLEFMSRALSETVQFEKDVKMPDFVKEAVDWVTTRGAQEITNQREHLIRQLEQRAEDLRSSGACDRWFNGADSHVRGVAREINGPLLEELAAITCAPDAKCIECFRHGAQLLGKLPCSGIGEPFEYPEHSSTDDLMQHRCEKNQEILASLREDKHSQQLHELTMNDAKLYRMSQPILAANSDLRHVVLTPRFSVEQGLRPDGSLKIRACDDCTRSGVNCCVQACEKLRHDSIDCLFECCRRYVERVGHAPGLWKADIDAAFRRVPIAAEHRFASVVVYLLGGDAMASTHFATPFGAVASVHAWERVGALLAHFARRYLFLPVLRYVDDYFSVDHPATNRHAMNCFARLIHCTLGPSALAANKLCFGQTLGILGLSVTPGGDSFSCFPLHEKLTKWSTCISAALSSNKLLPGQASKLAGGLSWAAQNTFHRLGRAMLRPIFAQCYNRSGRIGRDLRLSLFWWLQVCVLHHVVCEFHPHRLM